MAKNIIEMLIQLTLVGSGISLLHLILKNLFHKHLNLNIQTKVWMIVLLFFIFPFQIPTISKTTDVPTRPITNLYQDRVYPTINRNLETSVFEINDSPHTNLSNEVLAVQPKKITFQMSDFIFMIWVTGALICMLWKLGAYFKYKNELKKSRIECDGELKKLFKDIQQKQNIRSIMQIYFSDQIKSAILIGLFKPTIYLPISEHTLEQWNYILLHECRHQKNHDLIIKWFAMIVSWIHFFNPIIYLIQKEINKDCELACDHAIIQNLSKQNKIEYGNTIISMLQIEQSSVHSLTTAMTGSKKEVKDRILKIAKKENKKAMYLVTSLLIVALIVGCFIWPSVFKKPTENTDPSVETTSYSDLWCYDLMSNWGYTTKLFEDILEGKELTKIIKALPTNGTFIKYDSHNYDETNKVLSIEYDTGSIVCFTNFVFRDQMLENNAYLLFYSLPECNEILMTGSGDTHKFVRSDFEEKLEFRLSYPVELALYERCGYNLVARPSNACINNVCIGDSLSKITDHYSIEPTLMKTESGISAYQVYATIFYTDSQDTIVGFKSDASWSRDQLGIDLKEEADLLMNLGLDYRNYNNDTAIYAYQARTEKNENTLTYLYYELEKGVIQSCGFAESRELVKIISNGLIEFDFKRAQQAVVCYGESCGKMDPFLISSFVSELQLHSKDQEIIKPELIRFEITYENTQDRKDTEKYIFYENGEVAINNWNYEIVNWDKLLENHPDIKKLLYQEQKYLSSIITENAVLQNVTFQTYGTLHNFEFKQAETANQVLEELRKMAYLEDGIRTHGAGGYFLQYVVEDDLKQFVFKFEDDIYIYKDDELISTNDYQLLSVGSMSLITSKLKADFWIELNESVIMEASLYTYEDNYISLTTEVQEDDEFLRSLTEDDLKSTSLKSYSQYVVTVDGQVVKELPYEKDKIFVVLLSFEEGDLSYSYRFKYICL